MIGAGVVGVATAWLLLRQGHRVQLLDPCLQDAQSAPSGSRAALGVLMAQVFHRSSGRAWRLRQRSLELWSVEQLEALQPLLPGPSMGALYSPNDGQIDPGPVIEALLASSRLEGLQTRADRAVALQRQGYGWLVSCEQGSPIAADWLVITAGVGSHSLVEDLGHPIAMEPVLGQALELALTARGSATDTWQQWPGVVVWQGVNLVPKPMANGVARLWLGATLETSAEVEPAELDSLRHLHGHAPPWLLEASVELSWQGVRPYPVGQPAPVLKALEPTLLLASGHYRNGVLLAPASAEWVSGQITSIR